MFTAQALAYVNYIKGECQKMISKYKIEEDGAGEKEKTDGSSQGAEQA